MLNSGNELLKSNVQDNDNASDGKEQVGEVNISTKTDKYVTGKRVRPEKKKRVTSQVNILTTETEDEFEKNQILETNSIELPATKKSYDKNNLTKEAIAKLESRGVTQDIQERLGLKWVSKQEAQNSFYNFRGVSPYGCILIPYTLSNHIDRFYGQCYNFYPTKEIEDAERISIENKAKFNKNSKFRKYLTPYGLNRDEFPFYDPYLLLNKEDLTSKVWLITEDTFGVIKAAMRGYRCLSSRFGISLVSNEDIKTKENALSEFMGKLGYKIPWFPDNDWVNNSNVWTETIKSATHLNIKIGVFELSDEKIGLDEYIDQKREIIDLVDRCCSLEEFLSEFTQHIKFTVKKHSVSITTLRMIFKLDHGYLFEKFPDLKDKVIDSNHEIDSQIQMEQVLNRLFKDKIRFNYLTSVIEFPKHSDADLDCLLPWLSKSFGLTFDRNISASKIENHLFFLAKDNTYHPFEEYLLEMGEKYKDLTLDDLGNLAKKYLGTSNPLHNQILIKCLFLACVARILSPGCFIKPILVMTGRQSAGKTNFLRILMPNSDWTISDMNDLESKDAKMLCERSVIMEWGEVSRIVNNSSLESAKNWLTRTTDHYRPPYGRTIVSRPRRFITVGTTNDEEILRSAYDHTRFKIVPIAKNWKIPLREVRKDRDKIWGVMTHWWLSLTLDEQNEVLRFSELEEAASLEESSQFKATDMYEQEILSFCEDLKSVTLAQVRGAIGMMSGSDDAIKKRIGGVLRSHDWEPVTDYIYVNGKRTSERIYKNPCYVEVSGDSITENPKDLP